MKTFEPVLGSFAMQKKLSDFLLNVSRASMRALIIDYDGTLAPYIPDRELATPYGVLLPLLQQISLQTGTRLVIVTGRPAASAARLLQLPDVEIWGCNGLERLHVDGLIDKPQVPMESLQAIANATELLLNAGLGQYAERKFASIAIHWRGKEALAGHLTRRVLRAWSSVQHSKGVRLVPFDGGLEITVTARNKADVVQTILSELGLDSAVAYLGDDSTAEDAFGALHRRGLSVLVGDMYRTTLADVWIRPPDELTAFLSAWISACNASA
jgi:trehalose-phosphatase